MIDTFAGRTDTALIESILDRGFDPKIAVGPEDFLRLLADAEEIDAAGTPALPLAIADMRHEFGEIGHALTLPVAVGHRWLLRLLDSTTIPLEDSAIDDAAATLVRRLVPVLQQVVQFEAIVSQSAHVIDNSGYQDGLPPGDLPLLDTWLDRWRMFPVLASLVTLTLTNWINAIEEMLRAVADDHAEIAATLTNSTTPLAIRSIFGDAGDTHLGGRSVMILTFADDTRVVFKPKDLGITSVFRELIDRVNGAGFSAPLRIHRAIVRATHTWEEYISHHPCHSEAEVARFYHRMGGWIRLLQVLEGRDFWLDNLIAHGEFPIFIDLETVMQPRRRNAPMSAAAELVQDRIESSPLVTNIIAMPVPIGPGIDGEDLGCFAYPKAFLSPFPALTVPGASSSGPSQDGYRTWTHPEHAPVLNEEPVSADRWFHAIEDGYREMAGTLAVLGLAFESPGGSLDQLCAHPVRTIYRDTWTCVRIIHRSTAPPLLGSYKRRREFLERMDRDSNTGEATTDPVIASEVEAMISLDVPFFSAYGHSDAIHPPDREPVAAFYKTTSRECILTNLRGFSPELLEEDIALLRTAFWTTHRDTSVVQTAASHGSERSIDRSYRSAAFEISGEIASARHTAQDGTSSWTALAFHAMANIETLAPIGHDLLGGRAGLAVLFSDLVQVSSDERWHALALDSALEVAAGIKQVFGAWTQGGTSFSPASAPLLGAFTGIGGMLAAIKLVADTLGNTDLNRTWIERFDSVDWEQALDQGSSDVIGGATGLALALTAREEWFEQLPASLQTSLMAVATSEDLATGVSYPPGTYAKLAGLPGDRIARQLVRSRLRMDGEPAFCESFVGHLDASLATGDLLGAIEFSNPTSDWWPQISELAQIRLKERSSQSSRLTQIDAAEINLAMWRASGDLVWLDRARALADTWISDYETSGSWFPADLAHDRHRLSSILGLPAIVSIMLRLDGAPAVSSVRTLNWNGWSLR